MWRGGWLEGFYAGLCTHFLVIIWQNVVLFFESVRLKRCLLCVFKWFLIYMRTDRHTYRPVAIIAPLWRQSNWTNALTYRLRRDTTIFPFCINIYENLLKRLKSSLSLRRNEHGNVFTAQVGCKPDVRGRLVGISVGFTSDNVSASPEYVKFFDSVLKRRSK